MYDFLILVMSGALVGFLVGLTGVGGGSLMTPILLLLGYPPPVAIGTDLLYAAVTKGSGVVFHHQKDNVHWPTMALLAAGSIPFSLGISFFLSGGIHKDDGFGATMTSFLGLMLILTALVIILQRQIQRRLNAAPPEGEFPAQYKAGLGQQPVIFLTLFLGMILGICVTLTSVGAGAIGASILFLLYPSWKAATVVGTDIAHAVPLTAVAGIGYLLNGLVDLQLLVALLVGSIPGIYLGTQLGSYFPDRVMRGILAVALVSLGIKFLLP